MKITNIENLPSTNNSWGFGGANDIRMITMANGDIWRTGTACFRHLPSQKFIRRVVGGDLDMELSGTAEKFLEKFYGE